MTGGFESSGGRRSDGLKSEKHRDWRDVGGDVGGKLAASDDDDDRHRSSRGSRQSHKSSVSQQGNIPPSLTSSQSRLLKELDIKLNWSVFTCILLVMF